MIKKNFRVFLSAVSLFSMVFIATSAINAAPVRFNQVTQVVNAKPGKANVGNYKNLRLTNDSDNDPVNDPDNDSKNDGNKTETESPRQDRVITETSFEVVQDDNCNCTQPPKRKGFPYWALLGLAAIPVAIILTRDGDDDPTPTPTPPSSPTPTPTGTPTGSPTPTPTPSESPTPTPTPTMTPTPTPMMTPTPTPPTEPVPEPMTILLFGSGLAGIGIAARKRFGKRKEDEEDE